MIFIQISEAFYRLPMVKEGSEACEHFLKPNGNVQCTQNMCVHTPNNHNFRDLVFVINMCGVCYVHELTHNN